MSSKVLVSAFIDDLQNMATESKPQGKIFSSEMKKQQEIKLHCVLDFLIGVLASEAQLKPIALKINLTLIQHRFSNCKTNQIKVY